MAHFIGQDVGKCLEMITWRLVMYSNNHEALYREGIDGEGWEREEEQPGLQGRSPQDGLPNLGKINIKFQASKQFVCQV